MNTPISYYGGKQKMTDKILPLIDNSLTYVEPFFGGGAVFWKKQPAKSEIINDVNSWVSNFWDVCKNDFENLQWLVQHTMHCENDKRKAQQMLLSPESSALEKAWAFWVQTNMSFSNKIFGGFAFALDTKTCIITKKRETFTKAISERLSNVIIFNRDALEVIKMLNKPDCFMYLDPPYAESDCGHYEKEKSVYYDLLQLLPDLKCKWLMSSYPSDQLDEMRSQKAWNFIDTQKKPFCFREKKRRKNKDGMPYF